MGSREEITPSLELLLILSDGSTRNYWDDWGRKGRQMLKNFTKQRRPNLHYENKLKKLVQPNLRRSMKFLLLLDIKRKVRVSSFDQSEIKYLNLLSVTILTQK